MNGARRLKAANQQNQQQAAPTSEPLDASAHVDLPSAWLERLRALGTVEDYAPGQVILKEGQSNSDLFILLSGEATILSQGAEVNTIHREGDIFGEMSLLQENTCAATVVARTQIQLIKVNSQRLSTDSEYEVRLYRFFARSLCNKLNETNARAREVESLNSRLQSTQDELATLNKDLEEKIRERNEQLQETNNALARQNGALQSSYNQLADLNELRAHVMARLGQLERDLLPRLRDQLDEVEAGKAISPREIRNVLTNIEEAIGSFLSHNSIPTRLQNKRILLLEQNKKQAAQIRSALVGTGAQVEVATTFSEATAINPVPPMDVMFVSVDNAIHIGSLKDLWPRCSVVLLTEGSLNNFLPLIRLNPHIDNVVAKNEDNREFQSKTVIATVNKMTGRDLFGIDKYLAWGSLVHQHTLKSSDERRPVREKMNEEFRRAGLRRTLVERIDSVCEELLMNAIYDAPTNSNGESKYNHKDRRERIDLLPHEECTLNYACDGNIAAISVVDYFGALERRTLFQYLSHSEGDQTLHKMMSKGGGGHGLHMMVSQCDLLILNVRKNQRTEVIALFHLSPNSDAQEKFPNFQIFYET